MSAPFEPNSINIIKMKGAEAIFLFPFLFPPLAACLAAHQPTTVATQRGPAPMPKSKCYFLQTEKLFLCSELRTCALAWRHPLKVLHLSTWHLCCKGVSQLVCQHHRLHVGLLVFFSFSYFFYFFFCCDYRRVPLSKWWQHSAACCLAELKTILSAAFRPEPVRARQSSCFDVAAVFFSFFFPPIQLYASHMGSFNCTIIRKSGL